MNITQKSQQSKIIDCYQILQTLGRGANGIVYKGLNLQNGSFVAMKQMHLGRSQIKIIKSEINFLKQLNHPNIVKYLDAVQKQTKIYLILEYIQEGNLANFVKRSSFSQNLVKIYIKQVLQGLLYLHQMGVVHRDIKGANILLTKEGKVKLADFGVAVKISQSQKTLSTAGTPYWMAPEIILGDSQISTKCDIWSLGCTIIQLLTGNPPYHDLLQFPALFRIVQDQYPPLPPQVSLQCKQFLLKCFIKNPKNRPDASQLLQNEWLNYQQQSIKININNELINQYIKQWNFKKLQQLLLQLPNRKLIYLHPQFIQINKQQLNNNKLKFILKLIQGDYQTLKYISYLNIIKKSLPQSINNELDLTLTCLLLRQICHLCVLVNDIGIFLNDCLLSMKHLLMHGINNKDKNILSKIIHGIYQIVFQQIIIDIHLFTIFGNQHILSYLIMSYVAMVQLDQQQLATMILQILIKAINCKNQQIYNYFQTGVKHLIRIDVTINYSILCFHNLQMLYLMSNSQYLSQLMQRQGGIFYMCQFLKNLQNWLNNKDISCLFTSLIKYIQSFILLDINRKKQFIRHNCYNLLEKYIPLIYKKQIPQNISTLIKSFKQFLI